MAAADPLRATMRSESVPVPRSKRREPFDAALLCNKLEAHLREQDAALLRKEKRDAVRNGHYVPRVAAKAFAATTSMPMDDARPPRRASEPTHGIDEPSKMGGSVYIAPVQQYGALTFQWPAYDSAAMPQMNLPRVRSQRPETDVAPDDIAFIAETSVPGSTIPMRYEDAVTSKRPSTTSDKRRSVRSERRDSIELERRRQSIKSEQRELSQEESKHDSMNPTSSEGVPLCTSQEGSPRRQQYPQVAPRKSSITAMASPDRGRGQYRPGDAAKRRSNDLPRPSANETFHHHAERRASKFVESDAFFVDEVIPEDPMAQPQRPKLVAHDRPNWAQHSQAGDDTHLSLRFLSRTSKKKGEERSTFPRPKSVMENRSTMAPGRTSRMNSLPEEGHLIADAVKKIKREEKIERRKSIFGLTGLFKRSQ